jgi:hypothetical protein
MSKLGQISRLNQILIVLLIIQIALAVFLLRPQAAASESGPLLANFEAGNVTALTITDNEDNSIALAKKGEEWVLPDGGDYPAKGDAVATLLDSLAAVETDRLVTQTADSHKRLEVAEDGFNRRLAITLADGTTHQVFVGTPSGANATHIRVDDQPEVYLAGGISPWQIYAQPAEWIDPLYFNIATEEITGLTLENANGTFTFTRDGESWTLADLAEGETFSENNFSTLLSQSSAVRMTAPVGTEAQPAYGLAEPAATITVETADETYTLQIGAKDEEDVTYYFKASNSPYYVKIAGFTGDAFIEKTRDNFLLPPPTPEAESGEGEQGDTPEVSEEAESATPEAESED